MSFLETLVRNTAFSAVAFVVNGLIALALVSVIVGQYGLVAFGLLVLSRTLLPTGALAVLDFGIGETATQAVGRARGARDWRPASEQVTLLFLISAGLGGTVAAVLFGIAPWLSDLFRVEAQYREGFISIVRATAISLVVLFPGLVVEGVTKGFERFGVLRALEVAAMLAYAIGTIVAVMYGMSYVAVAYAFLLATCGRYVLLAIIVPAKTRSAGLVFSKWSDQSRREILRRALLMFQGKVLGAAQNQMPPLLIAALVGPAGVGIYDIVTRLPRFLKSTFGLLASALLPVAARLEGQGTPDRFSTLTLTSFWLIPYVTFPVFFAVAALARPILEAWIGPEFGVHWPWLVAMLCVPALQICLSVGQTMLQIRPEFMSLSNRISYAGVTLQFAISIVFTNSLGAMAFVFGAVLAAFAAWPFYVHVLLRSVALNIRQILQPLARNTFGVVLGCVPLYVLGARVETPHLLVLLFAIAAWVIAYWGAAYLLLLTRDARAQVTQVVYAIFKGKRT